MVDMVEPRKLKGKILWSTHMSMNISNHTDILRKKLKEKKLTYDNINETPDDLNNYNKPLYQRLFVYNSSRTADPILIFF